MVISRLAIVLCPNVIAILILFGHKKMASLFKCLYTANLFKNILIVITVFCDSCPHNLPSNKSPYDRNNGLSIIILADDSHAYEDVIANF